MRNWAKRLLFQGVTPHFSFEMRNTQFWCYAIDLLTLTWGVSIFVTTWQTKGTIKEIPGPQTCSIEHRSVSVLSSVGQYCIAHGRSPSCPEAGRSTGAVTGAQDWAKALPVPYSDLGNPSSPIRLFSEGWDRPHSDETTLRDNPFSHPRQSIISWCTSYTSR